MEGTCSRGLLSGSGDDDVPVKRAPTGKTCEYDGDCDQGYRCIKGSGPGYLPEPHPITLIHCISWPQLSGVNFELI